jgi:hypothetical protein
MIAEMGLHYACRRCFARCTLIAALLAVVAAPVCAQQEGPVLRLAGVRPGGVRSSVTESWGQLDFQLANTTDTDRSALVVAFYENRPDIQYARELWVPAQATAASWLPLGPAVKQRAESSRGLQLQVFEITEGTSRLILQDSNEKLRPHGVVYRKREPTTALVIATDPNDVPTPGRLPRMDTPADEAFELARVLRSARRLSEVVQTIEPAALPAWPKALDGIDLVMLAASNPAPDRAGLRALRQWIEQGGTAWVLLDQVEPNTVAALLGEAFDFQIVGRVGLTDFAVREAHPIVEAPTVDQHHERPVEFVRVLFARGETVHHTVNGWPVWFTRQVGRGKVLLTTLGPRGWYRPRTGRDPRSPYPELPALPVPHDMLTIAADDARALTARRPLPVDACERMLAQEIGYVVVDRGTAMVVLGLFLAGTLGVGVVLYRLRRLALLGWVSPAGALVAAFALAGIGETSRRAAPPTIAFLQLVDAVAGSNEAAVQGVVGMYRPDSGPVELAAGQAGFFEMDMAGVEGQTRRVVMTDMDAWHWENLTLPAGVRFAPFAFTVPTVQPLRATARFGPNGLEGRVSAEPFRNLADGLLTAPEARHLALHVQGDGSFTASTDDALASGQFLASTLLNDRQQRRQEVMRRLLAPVPSETRDDRHRVLIWADPVALPFRLLPDARMAGSAVLGIPLTLERPLPNQSVRIPSALVQVRQITNDVPVRLTRLANQRAEMHLRFQLPAAALPFQVERARLLAKIDAPSRRITIAGHADHEMVTLHHAENPLGPLQVDIAEERLLKLDSTGGLHIDLTISESFVGGVAQSADSDADKNWTIEYMELEVTGRHVAEQ